MSIEGKMQPEFPEDLGKQASFETVQKIGEVTFESFEKAEEPFGPDRYNRWEVSNLSWALERTDLTDPNKPFFDF